MAAPSMTNLSRTKVTPIPVIRSNRRLDLRVLTSIPVGKVVPIAAFGLLREDQIQSSRVRINFEMLETVEILMNAVNVRAMAYLVPNLAFERFTGIDSLNRSYEKQPEITGQPVVPYFTTSAFDRASQPIHTYMGKHARTGQMVNTAYRDAYNTIWNFRAANRSPDIAPRLMTDVTLAKAFWLHSQFAHVVPDFDQAIIDGEVPLNVVSAKMPVHGLSIGPINTGGGVAQAPATGYRFNKGTVQPPGAYQWSSNIGGTNQIGQATTQFWSDAAHLVPEIWAELEENGVTVSLSNIELARKTQAFAALRKQYTGLTDEWVIDLLMNGITVPEQAWRQPMLIADRTTIFGMAKRYSSTADDLTASVVNGATFIDMPIVCPRCPTGGVVMVTVEVMPEQLFERQMDPYFFMADVEKLPEFLRDTLDPEKVEIVENQYVDVSHATPTATFGYAPLNHQWNSMPPGIGGKFYRPTTDSPTDEARQRIWAVETANPTLSEDFYLCTNMHMKPFVVTNQDNFECVMRGIVSITGNTVFGNVLLEASDDYETIMGQAPIDRIDKPVTAEGSSDQVGTEVPPASEDDGT